jgi:hypothetical protein
MVVRSEAADSDEKLINDAIGLLGAATIPAAREDGNNEPSKSARLPIEELCTTKGMFGSLIQMR